jgi:hypothetical protein
MLNETLMKTGKIVETWTSLPANIFLPSKIVAYDHTYDSWLITLPCMNVDKDGHGFSYFLRHKMGSACRLIHIYIYKTCMALFMIICIIFSTPRRTDYADESIRDVENDIKQQVYWLFVPGTIMFKYWCSRYLNIVHICTCLNSFSPIYKVL